MASINRVMNLLDTPIEIHTGDIALPVAFVRGEIELKNVYFSYQNRNQIIQDLS